MTNEFNHIKIELKKLTENIKTLQTESAKREEVLLKIIEEKKLY